MKLSNRTKKLILLSLVVVTAFTLSGCSVPTDANNQIVQIYPETTFSEIMSSENWFSAIFVWPLSQLINWATPKLGVAGGIAVVGAFGITHAGVGVFTITIQAITAPAR